MKKHTLGLIMAGALSTAPLSAEIQFSEQLTKITSHLGEGGVHFSVTDSKGDLQDLAKLIDKVIGHISNLDLPPGMRVEPLLGDLGLYSLEGRGSSSHQVDDYWHNRSFVLTDGKHEGILSLLGDQSKVPAAYDFAPAGADLVFETSLNLRELERTAKKIAGAFGPEAEEKLSESLKEEAFELGLNIADIFADFTVRGTMVLWLDEEETFEAQPGMKLPVPHLAARLENAGMVWRLLEAELKKEALVVEKDGEVIMTPKDGAEQTPFGELLPQIVWNPSSKELFMGLSADDLATCRGEGARLPGSASYQKATAGFPEKMSTLAYVSSDVFRLIELLTKEFMSEAPAEGREMINEVLPYLEKLGVEGGYAAGVAVEKDGFLTVGNFPFPVKGDSSLMGPTGISAVAMFSGLATPAILKAKKSADKAGTVADLKKVGMLLMLHESEFSEFPKELGGLRKLEALDPEDWVEMEMDAMVYLPEGVAEGRPSRIWVYLELPELDQVVYLKADGSVQTSSMSRFQKLLERQSK